MTLVLKIGSREPLSWELGKRDVHFDSGERQIMVPVLGKITTLA